METDDIDARGFDAVIDSDVGINGVFTATDILITDYSASVFEYVLMRKPLVLFAPDLDEYREDPGFYLDYPADHDRRVRANHRRGGRHP